MRLKAIPTEAVQVVTKHPYAFAGVGVAAVAGAVLYRARRNAAAAPNASGGSLLRPDPVALGGVASSASDINGQIGSLVGASLGTGIADGGGATQAPASTGGGSTSVPASTPVFTGGSSGGGGGGSNGGGDFTGNGVHSYDQQLIDLQFATLTDNFTYQMAQLQLTASISAANAFLANAAINSNNFAIAAGLSQSFMNSGNQATVTSVNVPGIPGASFTFEGVNFHDSNKNGWDSNLAAYINNGTLANAVSMLGAVQPGAFYGGGGGGTDQNHNPVPGVPGYSSPSSNPYSGTMPNYFSMFFNTQPNVPQQVNNAPVPQQQQQPQQPAQQTVNTVAPTTVPAPMPSLPSNNNSSFPTIIQPSYVAPPVYSAPPAYYGGAGGGGGGFRENVQAA